jgi:Spy/CpxP family protein refolding chaperone
MACSKPTLDQRLNGFVDKVSNRLDLSADQKNALVQIKDEFFQKLKSQKDARLQLRNDTIALIKSDTIDQAKLDSIRQNMKDLNQDLQDFITGKFVDFHKTLTPAQKEKLADWIEKMTDRMSEMSGM